MAEFDPKLTPKYSVHELQNFFFKGMLQGWVGGFKPQIIAADTTGRPGYEQYEHRKGKLYLRDRFTINGDHFSGGTIIAAETIVLWDMHYYGWLKDEVVEFVKNILKWTYGKGVFEGGRGVNQLGKSSRIYDYANIPGDNCRYDFSNFFGCEQVCRNDVSSEFLGKVHCMGGALVPLLE